MSTTPSASDLDTQLMAGVRAHQAGQLDVAEQIYRELLAWCPDHADALHYLGLIAFQRGDHRGAVGLIERAIAVRGDDAPAEFYLNFGNALKRAGDSARSEHAYGVARERRPKFFPALFNLALLKREQGDWAGAESLLYEAVEVAPAPLPVRLELAECLVAQGKEKPALDQLDRVLPICDAPALGRAGRLLVELGRYPEAVTVLEKALPELAGDCGGLNALGCAYAGTGRLGAAAAVLRRALLVDPSDERAVDNLASVLREGGQAAEAVASYRKFLLRNGGASVVFRSNYLMSTLYVDAADQTFAEHGRWAGDGPGRDRPLPFVHPFSRPLRLAYLSGDFRNHPVAYFMQGILAAHDPSRVDVTVYDNTPIHDRWSDRLRCGPAHWTEVRGLSDQDLGELIRRDAIDVLIDLSGHTADNRLPALASHPAKVQASYLGYPHSTGLPWIDYRIVDAVTDPDGAERFSTERLVRLPRSYYAYTAPPDAPPVNPLPALTRGQLSFAVCSNLAKVSARTLDLWATVMRLNAGATLRWKARAFADPATRERMASQLAVRGVNPACLTLDAWTPHERRWWTYHDVDVALDTYPYNQATNTCEALWMGVPTLSFCGSDHRSRMGASILRDAGLDSWAMPIGDAELLPDIEKELAARLPALLAVDSLGKLRSSLRGILRTSRLLDAKHAAVAIEDACERMLGEFTG